MGNAATLRVQIESILQDRIPAALTLKPKASYEFMSCGIREIDDLEVFPRGSLVEICGPSSTGRTTILYGLGAQCTANGEAVAVIDVMDAFDPISASRVGMVLSELLWIRCGGSAGMRRSFNALDQALSAADLLLQSGGFGMVALDLGNVSTRDARKIPLATWFRFRRAVEGTRTFFVVLGQESNTGSSSASVLDLSQSGIDIEQSGRPGSSQHVDGDCLIQTLHARAEVLRGQNRKPVRSVRPTGGFSMSLQSYG